MKIWRFLKKEILSILFWLYIVVFLIINLDFIFIRKNIPSLLFIYDYRYIFMILPIFFLIFSYKKDKFAPFKIIFFPLKIIVFSAPYVLIKNSKWSGFFALIQTYVISFISFKSTLLGIYILTISIILSKSNNRLVIFSNIFLNLAYIIIELYNKLKSIKNNSSEVRLYNLLSNWILRFNPANIKYEDNEVANKELETLVVSYKLLEIAKNKIEDYSKSYSKVIPYILSNIISLLLIVLSNTIIVFSLYKLNLNIFTITFGFSTLYFKLLFFILNLDESIFSNNLTLFVNLYKYVILGILGLNSFINVNYFKTKILDKSILKLLESIEITISLIDKTIVNVFNMNMLEAYNLLKEQKSTIISIFEYKK